MQIQISFTTYQISTLLTNRITVKNEFGRKDSMMTLFKFNYLIMLSHYVSFQTQRLAII